MIKDNWVCIAQIDEKNNISLYKIRDGNNNFTNSDKLDNNPLSERDREV